ncbi:MAG: hypothetical protein EP340_06925 [Alphaproteobacteria bacterium]|nr:MAG: hypothetical protein EP340_06925 [Alphaproteobacteria bacterium]
MNIRLLILITAWLALSACTELGPFSDIPQPYRPAGKGAFDTAKMIMADHVVVADIEGLDEEIAMPLRKAIARALGENDILATTEAPPMRTSVLAGIFTAVPQPRVLWTLKDPYGAATAHFETDLPLDALTYPETEQETRKSIATIVALHLTGRPQADRPNLTATLPLASNAPASPNPTLYGDPPPLYFLPILGAPGDGNRALDRAMRAALQKRGIKVLNAPDPEDLQLQCFVSLRPAEDDQSTIQIFWEIKSPEGKSVASIDQANRILAGALDGAWGPLATDIAEAAADGIAQFLGQTSP